MALETNETNETNNTNNTKKLQQTVQRTVHNAFQAIGRWVCHGQKELSSSKIGNHNPIGKWRF